MDKRQIDYKEKYIQWSLGGSSSHCLDSGVEFLHVHNHVSMCSCFCPLVGWPSSYRQAPEPEFVLTSKIIPPKSKPLFSFLLSHELLPDFSFFIHLTSIYTYFSSICWFKVLYWPVILDLEIVNSRSYCMTHFVLI